MDMCDAALDDSSHFWSAVISIFQARRDEGYWNIRTLPVVSTSQATHLGQLEYDFHFYNLSIRPTSPNLVYHLLSHLRRDGASFVLAILEALKSIHVLLNNVFVLPYISPILVGVHSKA